jgi:diguanylate cyclase (GGDEF)-like protein
VVDYITKPFQQQEVLARVQTHLELRNAYKKLKKAYKDIEIAAKTDSMTKLSNRRDIIEKIQYEKIKFHRNGRPFSLVLSDIDDFKIFNDKYGHDCGDFILITVADILRAGIRKQDTVARWGGEEFLILMPQTSLESAFGKAEILRKSVAGFRDEYIPVFTVSFGVTCYRIGESMNELLRRVDAALYEAKNSGRNRTVSI